MASAVTVETSNDGMDSGYPLGGEVAHGAEKDGGKRHSEYTLNPS